MSDTPPVTPPAPAATPPATPATPPAPAAEPVVDQAAIDRAVTAAVTAERERIEGEQAAAAEAARIEGMEEGDRIKAEAATATAAAAAATASAHQTVADTNGLQALLVAGCAPDIAATLNTLMGNKHGDTPETVTANVERVKSQFAEKFTGATNLPPATPGVPPVRQPPGSSGSVTGIEAGRARAKAVMEAKAARDPFAHFKPIGA